MKPRLIFLVVMATSALTSLHSQNPHLLTDEWLWPSYALPRSAENRPGNPPKAFVTPWPDFSFSSDPVVWNGEMPTHRLRHWAPADSLTGGAYSVETWILDHVNQPVGMVAGIKGFSSTDPIPLMLGYRHGRVKARLELMPPARPVEIEVAAGRGFKNYFLHAVLVYDGQFLRLYLNGDLKAEKAVQGEIAWPERPEAEAAAYLKDEPWMEPGNLLLNLRLWKGALGKNVIQDRFNELQTMVERGLIWPDTFQFIAGPYLHYPTTDGVRLSFEADRPVKAEIRYGTRIPLREKLIIDSLAAIHTVALNGLEPGTRYYYEVHLQDETGKEIHSGPLAFNTARKPGQAVSFVVFGDTEARPHVNQRLAQLVWAERPDFLVHLGDITDGGQKDHKFEWNYEYFYGMGPLLSRVPTVPVAGNGESDLYWYRAYHHLPDDEDVYSFSSGDVRFFMLNSNKKDEFAPGGRQYRWLEKELASCTEKWKCVAYHHASFSSDEDDYGDTWSGKPSTLGDTKTQAITPLFETYGVDLVFSGHLHGYERTWPMREGKAVSANGVRYIVAGGAGGNLEDFSPTRNGFTTKLLRDHHYLKLDVLEGSLHYKMYDLEGRLVDFFEIKK